MEQIVTELGKISAGAAGIIPDAANSDARRRRSRRGGGEAGKHREKETQESSW
jgi:hypothetical protein